MARTASHEDFLFTAADVCGHILLCAGICEGRRSCFTFMFDLEDVGDKGIRGVSSETCYEVRWSTRSTQMFFGKEF